MECERGVTGHVFFCPFVRLMSRISYLFHPANEFRIDFKRAGNDIYYYLFIDSSS